MIKKTLAAIVLALTLNCQPCTDKQYEQNNEAQLMETANNERLEQLWLETADGWLNVGQDATIDSVGYNNKELSCIVRSQADNTNVRWYHTHPGNRSLIMSSPSGQDYANELYLSDYLKNHNVNLLNPRVVSRDNVYEFSTSEDLKQEYSWDRTEVVDHIISYVNSLTYLFDAADGDFEVYLERLEEEGLILQLGGKTQ